MLSDGFVSIREVLPSCTILHKEIFFWNLIELNRNQIIFTIFWLITNSVHQNYTHREIFPNLIKSNWNQIVFIIFRLISTRSGLYTRRNIFQILSNQTEIRLYLPLSDWFWIKLTSVWFQINRSMVKIFWESY